MPYYKNAKNAQKFIAAAVLTTFLVSPATTCFAQPSTVFAQPKINYESTFDSIAQKISGLPELGHIDDQFHGDRSHFLILIRDAHTQTDAQMKTAHLIHRITQEDDLVLIEGTPGKYAVDYFKEFPVKDVRDRVLKNLLEKNKITGPEFSVMTHDKNVQLIGIDDEKLYLENLRSFQECSEQQRNDLNVLKQVRSDFNGNADKLFSSEFKTFLKHSEFISLRPDSILLRVRFYAEHAERLKISLSDLSALTNMVQIVQEKLPPAKLEEQLNQSVFKNLSLELDEAENRIAEAMDNPTITKSYLAARRYFRYLEKTLQLTLTPDEKEELLTMRSHIYSGNNSGSAIFNLSPAGQEMLKGLESRVLKYIHFYDLAKSRDRYLIENIETQLNQRNKNWAVVIMGGYHSQNILDSLRQKGISYLSITPNFSLQPEQNADVLGHTYRNIMLQSKSLFSSPSAASHVIPLSNVQPSLAGNYAAVRDLYQSAGNAFLAGFDERQRDDVIAEWDQKIRGVFFPTSKIPGLRNFGSWLYVSPGLDRSVFLASTVKPTAVGLKPAGFGAAAKKRQTVFVNNRNSIQGSVGPIEVNWRWHPDSDVILILVHKLGGTRHSLNELVGDIRNLDIDASVVTYKSSRFQEARLMGSSVQDELMRVFGQKTFAQEVEDLRNVIRETQKIYQRRGPLKPPKIILVGQEYGGQLLPIVASEPEFSDIKHLILIRTPMKPLNEVVRELSGAKHPILDIPSNIGEFLSKFSGNVDVILWRGEPKLNESAGEWPEYKSPSSSITVQPIGNGTFSNPTTVGFFQAYLRELTEKTARGFGTNEPTVRTEVEGAMLRWFGPKSNRDDELELMRFLASKGESAIDAFVSLIEEDRAVKLGPYKIPRYRNLDQLPEAGTQTVAPGGKSYTLPFDEAEFEQMRINLMSEIVIQRSLGREITVHVGTGHVAQANIALASEAQGLLEKQAGRRFRGTIAGKERPYFSIAYQRPTSSSGYAVHFINNGQIPHPSTDQDMISNFKTGRRDGVIAATFLPEVMAIADVVLVETEFEMSIPPRSLFQQARINVTPTVKLLETIGSLIRKETLVIIESTVQPGFVSKEALPALNRIMQERFGMEKDNPTVRLVYSPQRLAPGPDEMRSLRKFRRESAAFSPSAEADLESYFKKTGFDDYQIWPVSEDVEFLKLLELAWFYDLLEILDGHLKAAEEFGIDAFKIIESIVRVHKRSRFGMRRVPNLCPGGSCTPEALMKIAMGLRTYFGMEDSQIFQIFQSRFLASSILQQRANEVIWKLLHQFTSDMSVPFSEVNVGVLGISYKEGIGNTKHSGSEHVVREVTHFGGHVEATDPFTDFWSELVTQNPRSSSSQARGRRNQDDLVSIPVRKLTDPLVFLHPELDALVFATRHFEYVGANQPAYKRQEHPDVGGSRKAHAGLDPIKVVAHMMGLEDKVIVDTYDFFSDKDYRIFLALDWRIEAFGKGHIYKGRKPLAGQITPEERKGYLSALLQEFQTMRDEPGIDQEKLDEAVRTTKARLAYWSAFITGESQIDHLKLDYERLKAVQILRYVGGRRRKTAELEKELAEAKLYHEAGSFLSAAAPSRSVEKIEHDLSEWKKESKERADEFLRSKVLAPIVRTVSQTLTAQGRLSASIGREMPTVISGAAESSMLGIAQRLTSLQHGILPQVQTLLESMFASPTLDSARPDIARNERVQHARPELRISKRKPRVPNWAKKRARELGFNERNFLVNHIYRRNADGKMERLIDPDGNSSRATVKWVGDMQKGKKAVPDKWTKFSVEVPLNLVPVEGLQVELYEDFMKLPWELREWLAKEVWGQGKILSTVAGEAQTKLRYMMEVNLDEKTVAPGRGGILFWGDSGEPILITSDMGDEFIFDLKSAGSFVEAKGEEIVARSGRVVQGGAGEVNNQGQHVITRVDLGALYPGHQAGGESDVVHLLRLMGTDAYFNGDAPRALFRLRFRYPNNDTPFEIIGRASPTNQRIGHIFKGGGEDFNPAEGARLMGWNAAEILTHHIANVHIALSPDNILSTGYYTDSGSNIDLFNERDPLKSFQKYFGYYLQLVTYNFNQAREFGKDSYEAPTPSLDSLQDWLNAFMDHFLESRYVANKEALQKLFEPLRNIDRGSGPQRFQYKNHTDPIQILTHVINDLSDLLWQHYLPYQLLRNRLDMGYDATRESTYSTTSGHLHDPGSLLNAEQFLEAQVELLTVAENLIHSEGYPPLQQRGTVFDFTQARNVLEQKKSHLRSLSLFQFPTPARYAGIYQIPFYSPLRPEIFTVVDVDSASSHANIHFQHAPVRSNGLFSKAPAGWLREVEPAVRRIRQFGGKTGVTFEGNFSVAPLIQAYFDAWVRLNESTADLFELEKPWQVLLQIYKDFLNAGALGGDLDRLRTVVFERTFVLQNKYYAQATLDNEKIFIEASTDGDKQFKLVDETAFKSALTELSETAADISVSLNRPVGFGLELKKSLQLIGNGNPVVLRVKGQEAIDAISQELGHILLPNSIGKKVGSLVIDDPLFLNRVLEAGKSAQRTTSLILQVDGFKTIYLVDLPEISAPQRKLIAAVFGIPLDSIIGLRAESNTFSLANHYGAPIVAALSGKHQGILRTLQSYALLHPNTVLLLAGENFSSDELGQLKRIGVRVFSMTNAMEMLTNAMEMLEVFGQSA